MFNQWLQHKWILQNIQELRESSSLDQVSSHLVQEHTNLAASKRCLLNKCFKFSKAFKSSVIFFEILQIWIKKKKKTW